MRGAALAIVLGAALASGTASAAPSAPALDEVARAFAVARQRGALVLVDVWAPW